MGLNVRGISKRFGNDWALRDIALTVDNGEIFGLLGPPGSGKSVLLDILAGSVQPVFGTLEVASDDQSTSRTAQLVRPFNYNHQRTLLSRLFSNRKVAAVLSPKDLEAIIKEAFERAPVVLLDEPFENLDHAARDLLAESIRNLALSTGASVIFAANNFCDICRTCDRAAILIDGVVAQTGTPKEIYDVPVSRTSALLTGRINLFEARRLSSSKAVVPEFITLNGEHRILTKQTALRSLGAMNQNVTLGIRPEDVHISFGASFPADNLLRALVINTRFFGDYTLVMLDAGGLALQAQVNKLVGLGIGEECIISLAPDRIHYLNDL